MTDFMDICEKAVRASGALLMARFGRVEFREKGRADLVTEADYASQELVRHTIMEAFPDHRIIGEEDVPSAVEGYLRADASGYRWIVDPLDGTTNYVHRVPHFSVSLALERQGELLVAAVYDPAADECFTAAVGQGAYLNGVRLRTSGVADLSHALCAVGFPAVVTRDSPDLRLFLECLDKCQAFRRMGCASLNLCYVAAGRFDAAWSFSTKPWDAAAGALLVREAGGIVSSATGRGFDALCGKFLAAANARLHQQIVKVVQEANLDADRDAVSADMLQKDRGA